MAPKSRADTVRLAVQSQDGRRSSVWRVWVSGDEVYVAPRAMAGQVKVSLHSSGYVQQGPTKRVREMLPAGERAAFDRWRQREGEPGVLEPGYLVYFTGSQLLHQDEPPPPGTLLVPSTRDDHEVRVGLFLVEPPVPVAADAPEPLHHLARLPLKRGAVVDLLWCEVPLEEGRVEEARWLHYNGDFREFPTVLADEWDYGYAFAELPRRAGRHAGQRWAMEIAIDHARECRLLSMRWGRRHEVRWEVPGDPDDVAELEYRGRRYVRLRSDFRDFVDRDGPPVYLRDDLEELTVLGSAELGDRDEARAVAELHRAVADRADLLVRWQGARPLMATQTVTLPSREMFGFCVLMRPRGRAQAGAAAVRGAYDRWRSPQAPTAEWVDVPHLAQAPQTPG